MDSLSSLVNALRCLPGVGPKSAQRMVYHLLHNHRENGVHLATCLQNAMEITKNCIHCNNYTDHETCKLCQDTSRERQTLCVVESPSDIAAIEQSNAYSGSYFVLMGKISPLDGLGPEDIGLPKLQQTIIKNGVQELIIALSPSIEGQTTIHFIQELLKPHDVRISQLAHGIPSGGELEFLDGTTISTAVKNRALIA